MLFRHYIIRCRDITATARSCIVPFGIALRMLTACQSRCVAAPGGRPQKRTTSAIRAAPSPAGQQRRLLAPPCASAEEGQAATAAAPASGGKACIFSALGEWSYCCHAP